MIVKVKIENIKEKTIFYMMFGDGYKRWQEQFSEFQRYYKDQIKVISFSKSKERWIGWGGLKWCSENDFQFNLNREGRQIDEPDNPKPRQYKKMKFVEIPFPSLLIED